jgi:DNA-binding NtrC family response regulator
MSLKHEQTNPSLTPVTPGANHVHPPRRILLVEDDEQAREQLQRLLQTEPDVQVDVVGDGAQALKALAEHHYSIAITDLRMPGCDGMELMREVQKRQWSVTVIVTTGFGSIDDAVEAIRLGAYDFILKPINIDNLRLVVQRALRERALRDEVVQLRAQLNHRYSFFHIISKNPKMLAVFDLIGNLAHTNTTVLIEGETGTGKEQIARAIHQASHNRKGPMVAVNCAALPENLLESELFGHQKGSFTNAMTNRTGRFELANGGTLFLDEIGDVPASMQVKLLRVLQERRFERVGGTESIEVDVRVIAATNRSLQQMIKKGIFREDLYYRLNVVKIELPPLRDRAEDVPLLATHFAEKFAVPGKPAKQISPTAMEILLRYSWPGNIRELENVMERACITGAADVISPESLPPELTATVAPKMLYQVDIRRPLPELLREVVANIERQYISKALRKTRGHVGRCAKISGLSRRSITAKIAEYDLKKEEFKETS